MKLKKLYFRKVQLVLILLMLVGFVIGAGLGFVMVKKVNDYNCVVEAYNNIIKNSVPIIKNDNIVNNELLDDINNLVVVS